MPMAPVSPSPLIPMAIIFRLATTAPVATDGMRPCTELNPCDVLRKYAGLLLEQPMPESLMTSDGSMPSSKNESMMRSVIALCPHPAQSVVLLPRYATGSSPIRLIRFPGTCGCTGVDIWSPLDEPSTPNRLTLSQLPTPKIWELVTRQPLGIGS